MAKLPNPISVTDEYLKAILLTQEEILGELKKKPESTLPAGLAELKEPAGKRKAKP